MVSYDGLHMRIAKMMKPGWSARSLVPFPSRFSTENDFRGFHPAQSTSSMVVCPKSAKDVTPKLDLETIQGMMLLKRVKSGSTLMAIPWKVTHRRTQTPEPRFYPRNHDRDRPKRRRPSRISP